MRRRRRRDLAQLVGDLDRLRRLVPGGSPERPLDAESPAAIEAVALRTPCALCDVMPTLVDHRAHAHGNERLREVVVRCSRCGRQGSTWFRLAPSRTH